ncbi:MAG: hypothetical protein QM768_09675 [Agriterribacter sp.]
MKRFILVAIALSSLFGTCGKDPVQPYYGTLAGKILRHWNILPLIA